MSGGAVAEVPFSGGAQADALLPRRPKIDLEAAPAVWSRIPEIAHYWNGTSVSAPIVEPYLVKCMGIAKQRLGETDIKLKQQIDLFIRQESNHFQYHKKFNKRLQSMACEDLAPLEREFSEDFRSFLNKKSLAFNLAYCAGFENFSMYTAMFVFGPGRDIFDGADKGGSDLFLWHLAEEFEHRALCHDVFRALSGNYFTRVHGVIFSFLHLNGFIGRAIEVVMASYRNGMAEAELRQSTKRENAFKRRLSMFALPRMMAILVPFYNPLWYSPSTEIKDALKHYEDN